MAHGNFIWFELMSPDPVASATFYSAVFGWDIREQGHNDEHGETYRFLYAGEAGVGGLMLQPEPMRNMKLPPVWQGYIMVDDVDAACAAITGAGGRKWMDTDMPGVGRFAVVNDPQGASFYVMTPVSPEGGGTSRSFEPGTPGHVGWCEYHGKDGDAALAFYTQNFGWAHDGDFDMGPMGQYHLFAIGGAQAGGIMSDANFPHPAWLYYFVVADIEAAKRRIEGAGGSIVNGPHEVPGGQMILVARDAQGGMFAAVTARGG